MATEDSSQPRLHTFGGEKRDPSAYSLDDKWYPLQTGTPEFEFWSTQTGFLDEQKLKQHIIKVQSEAHAVSLIQFSTSSSHVLNINTASCFLTVVYVCSSFSSE